MISYEEISLINIPRSAYVESLLERFKASLKEYEYYERKLSEYDLEIK
jgi:hypothetical protein